MPEEESIKQPLRWPHIVAFALLASGFAQLFSRHWREMLLYYSIAAGLGYGSCRPREPGESRSAYIRDPGHMAMLVLASLGSGVFIYWLITGHF
jgi:hypothetical protein